MIYNNNIGTSKVFYSGFTITRVYACGGELVWSESPFTFKAQYTLNDATSGEAACNGDSTLKATDFGSVDTITNIRYMTVGECVDSFDTHLTSSFYTSLRTLDLSHSNITIIQQDFMKNVTSLRQVSLNPSTTTISKEAFSGCTSLSAITIPSSVTSIGSNAFSNSGLRDITIHSGITYDAYVYRSCSAATAVTIEQGTLRIEQGTFAECTSLSSVTFPSSITYVGTQAFMLCTGLESLTFTSTTPPNLGENVFNNTNNCPIYVPCSAMAAYLAHEDWQPYVDRLRPIESQCGSIQYRWTPSGTTCIDYDKYQNNIKQVTYNSGTTWMNVSPAEYSASTLIEHNSEDCGYIEPQYRTITSTTCINTDKWQQDEYQVSTDGGQTWTTTGTSATTLIEANSYDCGYRTRTTSGSAYCNGVDKYVDVYDQVSTDGGQSWTTTATTHSLVEADSFDCGYRTRTVSTATTCVGVDKHALDEYQVSTDSGSTWTTVSSTTGVLIEADSEDCGYIPPQYRTLTTATTCVGVDKHTLEEYQVSTDGGQTWTTTGTSATTLLEANSYDCGYRTRTLTTATTCVNCDKHTLEEYQVSTDAGVTWTTTGTSATTLIEANSYDCGYRTRTTSGTPYCNGYDKYVDVYSQVSRDSGTTWTTTATTPTLVEAQSEDCGYVPPIEPQYRTITSTTCVNVDKWQQNEYQVSYDEGQTWTTTGTSATTLLEANSYDCGYRTRTTSSATYCDGVDKYVDVYDQVSTDAGQTWTTTATTKTLVEANSYDCGYRTRTTSSETYCDGDDLYVDVYSQVSTDSGSTWTTTATTKTLVEAGGCATPTGFRVTIKKTDDTICTSYCDGAYSGYTAMTQAEIKDTISETGFDWLDHIKEITFGNCTDLTTLSGNLLGNNFNSSITSVTFNGSSVSKIGTSDFTNLDGLQSVDITDNITSVGKSAFYQCSGLTSVTISSACTEILNDAFGRCSALTNVTINAVTPPTIGTSTTNDWCAFDKNFGDASGCPIYVPSQSVNAYKAANGWSRYSSRIQAIP